MLLPSPSHSYTRASRRCCSVSGSFTIQTGWISDSGKRTEAGLGVSVHHNWTTQSRMIDDYCSPDIETLSVIHRPFYLPREPTAVIITAVDIPPDANTSVALNYLHDKINKQQRAYTDGVHIIAGDFNKACLRILLPNFPQHVKCPPGEGKHLMPIELCPSLI